MTIDPGLLDDLMAASDTFADEISRHHTLEGPERVQLAQTIEDAAVAWFEEREEPCGFCHGRTVRDAAAWVGGRDPGPVACPRCGKVAA